MIKDHSYIVLHIKQFNGFFANRRCCLKYVSTKCTTLPLINLKYSKLELLKIILSKTSFC